MPETPRILIVDDEKRFRVTMLRLLKNNGISAKGVESGEQALEELAQNPYDVVLLDVKMPGISGIEVLKQMQKQGCDAEVIVLSGHASVDAALEIMNFGAYDYLLKPRMGVWTGTEINFVFNRFILLWIPFYLAACTFMHLARGALKR